MELMQNVVDYGDAPSFFATDLCRIFLRSPNIVRVTFVCADRRSDGVEEQRVSGHMDCDITQLPVINARIRAVLAELPQASRTAQPPGNSTTH